ncbi:MAG: anion permease [Candidatus Thorarchaeota archaeon]|nr:anion permease [Candidatus Thorarchaeota archaeon]
MEPIAGPILLVFVGTYLLISSEKVNRTAMAMTGMGVVGLILWIANTADPTQGAPFEQLVEHIEWHTILFITAMMIIVAVASSSGMFQYIAISISKPTEGNPRRLFVIFNVFVFAISLFFDTVSTILIIAPLTIEVCNALELDFRPFLISEAIVCNFASIPSIVGAVPNLVIADKTGLSASFLFLLLMPLAIILLLVTIPILLKVFENQLVPGPDDLINQMLLIDPEYMIRSRNDFYMSIVAILVLVFGFTVGTSMGAEPAMIAIIIAFFMLLVSREYVDNILRRVGWGTVFFLVGIFGLVAALDITGVIDDIGAAVGTIIGGDVTTAILFLIWIPAGLSAVIDNIPVSVVLAPLAVQFATVTPVLPAVLILAVNVGGYLLPIGAPANLLVIALAEVEHRPITLASFAKIATTLAIIHLAIGTAWLLFISFFV